MARKAPWTNARIDAALDYFFDYQRKNRKKVVARRLNRRVVARCIKHASGTKVTLNVVSGYLQAYRDSQSKVQTKYHIAARGYGRAGMWYVLSGPNLPVQDSEGMILAHAEWISTDLSQRAVSDFLRELLPAADQHPVIKPRVDNSVKKVEQILRGLLNDVRTDKSLWEQATRRQADMIPAVTAIEAEVLDELSA